MFEMVQEPDYDGSMSRTMVYLILHGEVEQEDHSKLTERGKEQIAELARSRLVSGPAKIYSPSNKACKETSEILAKELFSKTQRRTLIRNCQASRYSIASVVAA